MKSAYKPVLLSILIVSSIYLGTKLMPTATNLIFSSQQSTGIHKFNELLNYIEDSYVDTIKKDVLIEEGIQSLLRDLDPHSYYIPKSRFKDMNEELEGNFEGIGIEFRIIADTVMVMTTVKGGPSEKVGLLAGDRIVTVNDSEITGVGIQNEDVMRLLKGARNTVVNLGIRRSNITTLMSFSIKRDRIPVSSVQCAYMIDDRSGYVRIDRFSKSTYQEFKQAIDSLIEKGMKSIIADLRGNPGGLLNEAIKMANEFLKKDKVIVYTEGKARPKKVYYADADGSLLTMPLIILLDEGSASASEVLAGAIQDNDRGYIVGRRSFGKGLVQEQVDWPDGSALRLTVARYYTPTGRSIQKPYKNVENYHLETIDRLQSGELDYSDSIHVIDSLKYFTPQGRVVYGGGGIVPDVFVPVDSLLHNLYYNELYRKSAIQNFAFRFVDSRRSGLKKKYPNWQEFSRHFQLSEVDFEHFVEFASRKGVARNPRELARLKNTITADLKAQFARHLYGDEGYFPILNQNDRVIKESLKLISQK